MAIDLNGKISLGSNDWTIQQIIEWLYALRDQGEGVSDTVYGAGWNGVTTVAPSKNALYDKIQTFREALTGDRTYYVRTDGNDSNNGLTNTAGGAFLTINAALNHLARAVDFAGYSVEVKVAAGTYTTPVVIPAMVGIKNYSSLWLHGDYTNPSSVIISVTDGTCINADGPNALATVEGFRIQNTVSGFGLVAGAGAFIQMANMDFGSIVWYQMLAAAGSYIRCWSNYSISGGAGAHVWAEANGTITFQSPTVTITGTPAFGNFAVARGGYLSFSNCTYSGSATGSRYTVDAGGVIIVPAADVNYLPGNIAGSGTNFSVAPWGLYT